MILYLYIISKNKHRRHSLFSPDWSGIVFWDDRNGKRENGFQESRNDSLQKLLL